MTYCIGILTIGAPVIFASMHHEYRICDTATRLEQDPAEAFGTTHPTLAGTKIGGLVGSGFGTVVSWVATL